MKLFICLNLRHYNETPTGTTHTFETPRMQLHAYIYSSDDEKGHWAFRPKNVRIGGPQLTMRTRLNVSWRLRLATKCVMTYARE